MLSFDAERLESAVAGLPADPPGLSPERTIRYRNARARLGRHHGLWRDSLPSLLELFDDDAHQAKALAGNLATELDGALRAGIEIAVAPGGRTRPKDLAAWSEESVVEWRSAVGEVLEIHGWESEAREVFEDFLGELTERGRDARHDLIAGARTTVADSATFAAVAGFLTRLTRPLVRLFRPGSGP